MSNLSPEQSKNLENMLLRGVLGLTEDEILELVPFQVGAFVNPKMAEWYREQQKKRDEQEGLVKCEVCGEYQGKVMSKDLNWDNPFDKKNKEKSEEYLGVSCLCVGIPCPKCEKNKIHRPISNSYDERSNSIEHWPWFSGMMSC